MKQRIALDIAVIDIDRLVRDKGERCCKKHWKVIFDYIKNKRPTTQSKPTVQKNKDKKCPCCHGTGEWYTNQFSDSWGRCYACKGTGKF